MDSHVSFSTPHDESTSLRGLATAIHHPTVHCCCTCCAFQAYQDMDPSHPLYFPVRC